MRLPARRSPTPLFASAPAEIGVLLLGLVVGAAISEDDDVLGVAVVALLAGVLPIVTAVSARLPATLGWTRSGPPV